MAVTTHSSISKCTLLGVGCQGLTATQGRAMYMAQLLGVDFSLNYLWRVCHRAELQSVNVLLVVDLGKNRHRKCH